MRLRLLLLVLVCAAVHAAAPSYFEQAEAALADGDFARARSLAGLAASAGDPDALALKADAALALGDAAGAAEALQAAARAGTGVQAKAWAGRAGALRKALQSSVAHQARPDAVKAAVSAPEDGSADGGSAEAAQLKAQADAKAAQDARAAQLEADADAKLKADAEAKAALAAAELKADADAKAALEAQARSDAQQALDVERRALEDEKRKLAEERAQLQAERDRSHADADAKDTLSGGLGLFGGFYQPDFIKDFNDPLNSPTDIGAVLNWKGLILEGGIFNVDLAMSVTGTASPCPTCPNEQTQTLNLSVPWVALGYDWMPWRAGIGQWRPYLPLGVRVTFNALDTDKGSYNGTGTSFFAGLGLRWRMTRRLALDLSGRFHVTLSQDDFKSEAGLSLLSAGGSAISAKMGGPELRAGLFCYLW